MKNTKFVICIENSDYPVSLEKRKIYEVLPDSDAAKTDQIRVIDESGEKHWTPRNLIYPPRSHERVVPKITLPCYGTKC